MRSRSKHIQQAAAGIGEEMGNAFAEAGALGVVFADINAEGAAENAEKSKAYATNPAYKALSITVDTTDQASVQEMVDFTIKEFGRINYSINSAGVCILNSFLPSFLTLNQIIGRCNITRSNIRS